MAKDSPSNSTPQKKARMRRTSPQRVQGARRNVDRLQEPPSGFGRSGFYPDQVYLDPNVMLLDQIQDLVATQNQLKQIITLGISNQLSGRRSGPVALGSGPGGFERDDRFGSGGRRPPSRGDDMQNRSFRETSKYGNEPRPSGNQPRKEERFDGRYASRANPVIQKRPGYDDRESDFRGGSGGFGESSRNRADQFQDEDRNRSKGGFETQNRYNSNSRYRKPNEDGNKQNFVDDYGNHPAYKGGNIEREYNRGNFKGGDGSFRGSGGGFGSNNGGGYGTRKTVNYGEASDQFSRFVGGSGGQASELKNSQSGHWKRCVTPTPNYTKEPLLKGTPSGLGVGFSGPPSVSPVIRSGNFVESSVNYGFSNSGLGGSYSSFAGSSSGFRSGNQGFGGGNVGFERNNGASGSGVNFGPPPSSQSGNPSYPVKPDPTRSNVLNYGRY